MSDNRDLYGARIKFLRPIEDAVHDGDSLCGGGAFGFDFLFGVKWDFKGGFRLLGCDTPELHPESKGRTTKSLDHERAAGLAAKNRTIELLKSAAYVYLESKAKETDKFGRVLGALHLVAADGSWQNLADILVAEGHAYRYHGEAKQHFDSWYHGPAP